MARPVDHRAVPLHQDGERQLGDGSVAAREPLEELPVGLLADHARVEERLDLLDEGPRTAHRSWPSPTILLPLVTHNGRRPGDCSRFFQAPCQALWRRDGWRVAFAGSETVIGFVIAESSPLAVAWSWSLTPLRTLPSLKPEKRATPSMTLAVSVP